MNWEALGAIAETFGAIGVIATLLYLARQIRQSTKTAEDAAFRDIFTGTNDQLHAMMEPGNRGVLFEGLVDYDQLHGQAKFTFDSLLSGYFNMLESSIISNEANMLGDDTMENWTYYLQTRFLAYPGVRAWWSEAKGYFSSPMRMLVDDLIEQTDETADLWGIK